MPVPYERVIVYPCEGFCVTDLMALVVLATALTFITTGEKLHKYLICAMGMTIGTFAGLFYCAQLGIEEDKPKWSVSLAAGLALIALGSGGIKPCVSANVGDQFGVANTHLLPRTFSYFYLAINLGSFASTLITPALLASHGPHAAFGLPGVSARPHLQADEGPRQPPCRRPTLPCRHHALDVLPIHRSIAAL